MIELDCAKNNFLFLNSFSFQIILRKTVGKLNFPLKKEVAQTWETKKEMTFKFWSFSRSTSNCIQISGLISSEFKLIS